MNSEKIKQVTIGIGVLLGAIAVGLWASGNLFWGSVLLGTAGVLFGASGLCQSSPGENRRTNQAIHPGEEEEERTEDSDHALISSHEHVMEMLGRQEREIEEEVDNHPLPGEPEHPSDTHERGRIKELQAAAQKEVIKLMNIAEGETSSDNPAPSPM